MTVGDPMIKIGFGHIFCLSFAVLPVFCSAAPPEKLEKLSPVPFTQVTINDSFWAPRQLVNRKISILHSFKMLEEKGYQQNFELAAKKSRTGFTGLVFMDSDVYKVLESASFSLATSRDKEIEANVDKWIGLLAAAQMPDGYLNTYYQINMPDKRLTNLRDNHELYCAGHLFEAAAAHYAATGKKTLLTVAEKYADFFVKTFGDGPGQRKGYCGHPEIELALMKLYKASGKKDYLNLCSYFINNRGTHFFAVEHNTPDAQYDGTYFQDDVPIREHTFIKGHAVRAAYLMSGTVDLAAEQEDNSLLAMVDKVWHNTVYKNMFITGGIGSSGSNEGFTHDYDLPNESAYQETCASIAMVMWNHRLGMLYGDSKYADVFENTLYNGFLSGVSLDGLKFFYVNPLASTGGHHRSPWFSCACCPPNVTRTLASLGGYAYGQGAKSLWVNLFIQGSVKSNAGEYDVKTNYPWDGKVTLTNTKPTDGVSELKVRIPGWCDDWSLKLNGVKVIPTMDRGYATLVRDWSKGDKVEVNLEMPVRRVAAHPWVKSNQGKLAIARGPVVYCMEGVDNSQPLSQLSVPADTEFKVQAEPKLLGGVVTLTGQGLSTDTTWKGGLYATAPKSTKVGIKAIPYYAWDNRAAGEMKVWFPTTPPAPVFAGLERSAKVSLSNTSGYAQPRGINDGIEPASSGEQPAALCHFWPRKGTSDDWIQYSWTKPVTINRSRIYWFDDTGRGECRIPVSASMEYLDGSTWKTVNTTTPIPVGLDKWAEVDFQPITTTAIRLRFVMKKDFSVGVHEWQVWAPER